MYIFINYMLYKFYIKMNNKSIEMYACKNYIWTGTVIFITSRYQNGISIPGFYITMLWKQAPASQLFCSRLLYSCLFVNWTVTVLYTIPEKYTAFWRSEKGHSGGKSLPIFHHLAGTKSLCMCYLGYAMVGSTV
jgi:hypothetical protein